MSRFNRNYRMLVETNDGGQLSIELPFSVSFRIFRNLLNSANVASFRIYNLSEKNRLRISKDRMDYGLKKSITFLAGYGNNLSVCLKGNVTRCHSHREGSDFITTIECFDAGFAYANADISVNYPSGTSRKNIYLDIIQKMKPFGVEIGGVGDIEGVTTREASYFGNGIEILKELTSGAVFIDNEKVFILSDAESFNGDIFIIDSTSGLLGTPIREETVLTFDMLFDPRLLVGQVVRLNSATAKNYNQDYKVQTIEHQGMISASVAGEAKTTLGLFIGGENLRIIQDINV